MKKILIWWLQTLAAKFLYYTKASIAINLKVAGRLVSKTDHFLMYGCDVIENSVYLSDGRVFHVSEGRFYKKIPAQNHTTKGV